MRIADKQSRARQRRGMIAVKIGIVAALLFGMVALGVDVGYVAFTKTQLQAAADAATLSGGTELMAGLGDDAVAAATVATNAKAVAVDFASRNPNGDRTSSYANASRTTPYSDVRLGWAIYDTVAGQWQKNWGVQLPVVGGYNLIGVTLHRDQPGSTVGDGPLPLMFARILGRNSSSLIVDAAAVILPANGFVITPGSDESGNAMPFALSQKQWEKYRTAQEWYETYESGGYPNTGPLLQQMVEADPDNPVLGGVVELGFYVGPMYNQNLYNANNRMLSVLSYADYSADPPPENQADYVPLFGHIITPSGGGQDPEFVQELSDDWTWNGPVGGDPKRDALPTTDPATVPALGSDGVLELDLYPRDDITEGNFGTIDVGSASNGTPELISQIQNGVTADELATWSSEHNGEPFELPLTTTGDTGLSAGINNSSVAALDSIAGDCRAMFLFEGTVDLQGENAQFDLVEIAGIRVMHTELTGNNDIKHLLIQMCQLTATGATGDDDDQIGEDTTVFTPLILID